MSTLIDNANARYAAATAASYDDYAGWLAAGKPEGHGLGAQAIAIAYLPPSPAELLAAIAGASDKPVGQRYDDRLKFALAQPAEAIAEMVGLHKNATDEVEAWMDGSGAPPSGAAFGPVPPPPMDDDDNPSFRP